MQYHRLISGSDLRGVALPGYGQEVTLGEEDAAAALYAFCGWLSNERGVQRPTIAIGRDPRLSGPSLLKGALRGCAAAGASVIDCGLCTTPAMFTACHIGPKADGAVMITASHLPPERNGLKFMTADGGLTSGQIKAIVNAMAPIEHTAPADVTQRDFLSEYARTLRDFIADGSEAPLKDMRIAVDAGNGSGGFFADVLRQLGAQVYGYYLEPDGLFPNHPANPEDKSAMEALSRAVLESKAELGVIFDADCDRAALCDGQGRQINRDRLIALVASRILKESPGSIIVTDSVTSQGLAAFIKGLGGRHHRYLRGYRNVIDEAVRLNASGEDCPVAIETSGHCAFRDNRFLDDGAYLVCRLLRDIAEARAKGENWTDWIASLAEPVEDIELRVRLTGKDFQSDGKRILAALEQAVSRDDTLTLATDSYEGVRFTCPEGGFTMVRLSVHDPVLPINIQSSAPGGAKAMAARLYTLLMPMGSDPPMESVMELAPLRDYALQ